MPQDNKNPTLENGESNMSAKNRLKEITDSIEKGIKEVFDSENYKQYLQTMSRFHNYSLNNQILIYMQKPDAYFITYAKLRFVGLKSQLLILAIHRNTGSLNL